MMNELVRVEDKRGNEFFGEVVEVLGDNEDIIKIELENGDIVKFFDGVDDIEVIGNQALETNEIKALLIKTARWNEDYEVKYSSYGEIPAGHSVDLYIDGEYVDEIAHGSKSFVKAINKRLVSNRKRWGI